MQSGRFQAAQDFIEWLQQCRREEVTGTLLVMTRSRQIIRVGMLHGEIKRLASSQGSGRAVLSTIANSGVAVYRFLDGVVTDSVDDLPPTDRLLSELQSLIRHSDSPLKDLNQGSEQRRAEVDSDVVELVTNLLAEYAGPAAQWISEEVFSNGSDYQPQLSELASLYLTKEQRSEFFARLKQALADR